MYGGNIRSPDWIRCQSGFLKISIAQIRGGQCFDSVAGGEHPKLFSIANDCGWIVNTILKKLRICLRTRGERRNAKPDCDNPPRTTNIFEGG
jgi:hypothetical protein